MVPRVRTTTDAVRSQLPSAMDDEFHASLKVAVKPTAVLRRACKSGHAPRMTEVYPLTVVEARQTRKRHCRGVLGNSLDVPHCSSEEDSPAVSAACGSSPTFKGLAAIPLGEGFFGKAAASAKCISGRQCFQPVWSLIGTFKCNLHSLVNADLHHDVLKWYQQTPGGEFQQMRVPLSGVKEVDVVSPATEEAGAHWVVVRTSMKPSQIVFGFERLTDARRMKAAL